MQIDPVRINSIGEIGTPNQVGQRIVKLEEKKEGSLKVELVSAVQVRNKLGGPGLLLLLQLFLILLLLLFPFSNL